MDAPSLTAARSKELADLRRRAYGPHADIESDPAAQRRLHELEELARPPVVADAARLERTADVRRREPVATGGPEGERAEAEASVAPTSMTGVAVADAAEPAPSGPRRPWWRRVPLWAVTAALGVALGVAIGIAWPTDSEPPPDLVLDVEPGGGERGAGFTENLDY